MRRRSRLPPDAQGASFVGDQLYVSTSTSEDGKVYRLDRSGQEIASAPFAPGIEEIIVRPSPKSAWRAASEGDPTLLEGEQFTAVFEAGARRYNDRGKNFPLLASGRVCLRDGSSTAHLMCTEQRSDPAAVVNELVPLVPFHPDDVAFPTGVVDFAE